jgi:hypothetical protein
MLFTDPIISDYRLYFDNDFISPSVDKQFRRYFNATNKFFRKPIDFLNATIIGFNIPGLKDPGTRSQSKREKDVQYFSAISSNLMSEKQIAIEFTLKMVFFNWLLLKQNMEEYVDRVGDSVNKVFMSNINMDLIDPFGNIVVTIIFEEVQQRDVPSLKVSSQQLGIKSQTFSVNYRFNNMIFKHHFNEFTEENTPFEIY